MNISTKKALDYTKATRKNQKNFLIQWRYKYTIPELSEKFKCSVGNVKQLIRELREEGMMK